MRLGKSFKLRHYINYIVIGIATAVFGVMSMAGGALDNSMLFLLEKVSISIILAVSLSLVVGFLGELSLGHAGFMCVGAYLGGKVSALLEPSLGLTPVLLVVSLIVGAAVAAICGIIIGLPALRLRGDYLAIVTLAFGEIVKSLFQNSSDESFGGQLGLTTPRYDKDILFVFGLVMVLFTLMIVQNLMRSKHGRAITAIRDNEIAARATGVNVTKYKLLAFTISAALAGIAGVLYSFSQYNVQSANFSYNYSIDILVMVVLGGMGSINGAIIAATLITYLDTMLPTWLTGNLAVLQNLIFPAILIVVVIYNNAPALKSVRDRFNLSALADKLRKNDPANVKDDKAKWDVITTKINMDEILSVDMVAQEHQSFEKNGGEE